MELTEIIFDLQDCLAFDGGGKKPVRASSARWIAHKLSALKHIISKYGTYANHLVALSEDISVKAVIVASFVDANSGGWKQNTRFKVCSVHRSFESMCSYFQSYAK